MSTLLWRIRRGIAKVIKVHPLDTMNFFMHYFIVFYFILFYFIHSVDVVPPDMWKLSQQSPVIIKIIGITPLGTMTLNIIQPYIC